MRVVVLPGALVRPADHGRQKVQREVVERRAVEVADRGAILPLAGNDVAILIDFKHEGPAAGTPPGEDGLAAAQLDRAARLGYAAVVPVGETRTHVVAQLLRTSIVRMDTGADACVL